VLKWTCPELVNDVLGSPASPDGRLKKMKPSAKRRMLPSVA
jgi:hypothetical protein